MRDWTIGIERLKRWPHTTMCVVRDEAGEYVVRHASFEIVTGLATDQARRCGIGMRLNVVPSRSDVGDEWGRLRSRKASLV